MAVQLLHHVNLRVRPEHIRKLRDFYCDVIGLTEGWRPPFKSSGYWLYAGDSPVVHLVQKGPDEPRGGVDYGKPAIDHVAFRCSDSDAMAARLREHGIAYAISEVPELGDLQFLVHDPLGNGVELSFDRHATGAGDG
jgi:catechol 2,3-dioxygenase-like lactoylglutathione lyase family enzyme